jgi:hypothetical protein
MAKYVLTYSGGDMPASDDEMQKVMAAWGAWFGSLGGAIVDVGNPFAASKTVSAGGSTTDGGSTRISGYSIISAEDIDAAVSLVQECPALAAGGNVDVYEAVPVNL